MMMMKENDDEVINLHVSIVREEIVLYAKASWYKKAASIYKNVYTQFYIVHFVHIIDNCYSFSLSFNCSAEELHFSFLMRVARGEF